MSKMEILLLVLAILGGIDIAGRGVEFLSSLFPRILNMRTKMWCLLSDTFTIPATRRRAIAAGIEGVVNQTAFRLRRHLPTGWVRRVKIRWVRNSQIAQFHEGQIVLRVRPGNDPDHNLIQSLYTYFCSALFPDTRDILPNEIVSAIALAITRASLEEEHQYLLKEFDEAFLKTLGENSQNILDHFGDCFRLNEYGFLMGPFLREVDHVAKEARFSSNRVKIPVIIQEMLDHMLAFQPLLRINKPEDDWFYNGPCTSYGFILVSKPANIRPAIEAYVKRAQHLVQIGITRLYVIGRYEERDFVSSVIHAFLNIRDLKGIESFPLFRDYRGDANGLGALLGRDEMLAKLNLTLRPLDRAQPQLQPSVSSPSQNPEVADESQGFDSEGLASVADAQLDLAKIVEDVIVQLSDYDGQWIHLSQFGEQLRKQVTGFSPQRYGGRNLIAVLKRLVSIEFDERGLGAVYVRLRAGNHKAVGEAETFTKIVKIVRDNARPDGWMNLAYLGKLLNEQFPDIHFDQFGASSLSQFVRKIPALDFEERGEGSVYVRVKR